MMQPPHNMGLGYQELVAVVWTINRMIEGDPDLLRHNPEVIKAAMEVGSYINGDYITDVPISELEHVSTAVRILYNVSENSVVANYRQRLLEAWRLAVRLAIR